MNLKYGVILVGLSMVFACTLPTSSHSSVSTIADTLEQVQRNPVDTIDLCKTLSPTSVEQDCLLMGAENLFPIHPTAVEDVCRRLTDTVQGECWFRLAERTGKPQFCELATPFEMDCRLHLLSRWLFRHPKASWSSMHDQATAFGVDPDSTVGQTVLYRHLVSIDTPMNPSVCTQTDNPLACRKAAEGVYRDRLRYAEHQGDFPCQLQPNEDAHHNDSTLLKPIYEEFHRANCIP